eukprot:2335916-Alexandrium_andersonii.AAC.1
MRQDCFSEQAMRAPFLPGGAAPRLPKAAQAQRLVVVRINLQFPASPDQGARLAYRAPEAHQ